MDKYIKARILEEADYVINTKQTLRNTAHKFSVSKSTVHLDLSKRLKDLDESLYQKVSVIFKEHDENKHIKGGEVTKEKFKRG